MAHDLPVDLMSDQLAEAEAAELAELRALLGRIPGDEPRDRADRLLDQIERRSARLRAVVQDQTELVFRFHAGGRVTFVNQACCRYWRKERIELLGRPVQSLLPQDGWRHLLRVARRASGAEPVMQLEPRVLGYDGQPRIHHWTLRLIRPQSNAPGDGAVVGGAEYQVVGRDVTEQREQQQVLAQHIAERRRVEGELREETLRLEALLRAARAQLAALRPGADPVEPGRN
jgi:PAS domain S-box-containing protein